MLSVGLTGNVSCGKSAVARMFEELGAARLDADAVVRGLLAPGGAAVEAVGAAFPEALSEAGIDRAALAAVVFENEDRRAELESLLHPLVVAENRRRLGELESGGCDIAITEAALLFEAAKSGSAGADPLSRFDAIVVVTCDPEVQRARAVLRAVEAGVSEQEAEADFERRSAAQMPQAEKAEAADWVIDNSGGERETRRQVEAVREALLKGAAA